MKKKSSGCNWLLLYTYRQEGRLRSFNMLTIIAVVLLTLNSYASAQSADYGLHFKSQSMLVNERTSLSIEENKAYTFNEELSIYFDLFIRDEVIYGNVMTVKLPGKRHINLAFVFHQDKTFPVLIIDDESYELADESYIGQWVPVSICFNNRTNKIRVSYNNIEKVIDLPEHNLKSLQFSFGVEPTISGETPPMNIKDIIIRENNKPIRHWKLSHHNDDICYDEIKNAPAIATNPTWVVDNYREWKSVFTMKIDSLLGITFNPHTSLFYLIKTREILLFNPTTNKTNKIDITSGFPAINYFSHIAYDELNNKIISYSLHNKELSAYSFDNNTWSLNKPNTTQPYHHNHSRVFCEADSCFYFFGGYGFYEFKCDLFRLNLKTSKIEQINYSPTISPRSASSLAVVDNTLYIFGGLGNKTGKQEMGVTNYYDLYSIDLTTNKSKRLLEVAKNGTNMLLASTMYYLPQDSAFYVASMEGDGCLMKLSLIDSSFVSVSSPIFNKEIYQEMVFDLYRAPSLNKMFLVMDKTQQSSIHNVSIYSIAYPLIEQADSEPRVVGMKNLQRAFIAVILLIITSLSIILTIYLYKKRKRKVSKPKADISHLVDESLEAEIYTINKTAFFDRSKSSICLLGVFNVIDKNGDDITINFTPRLKGLLILLILHSQQNRQGILIGKLDEILWNDKDEISARNNRNVALRKLRVLLMSLGKIDIINENGFIRISYSDDIFCDYITICDCLKQFENNVDGQNLVCKIIEILLYGPLLPYTTNEWLDSFKSNYSSKSIDMLNKMLVLAKNKNDRHQIIDISNCLFSHDPLNEEALAAKCSLLCAEGKKGLAKDIYDKFSKEYKASLNEEYKTQFKDLLEYSTSINTGQ